VGKLRVGERKSRRWPVEELVKTGTNGRVKTTGGRPLVIKAAQQLRLIK
jgi:hypothetical protein